MIRLNPWVCLMALAVFGLFAPSCDARGAGGGGGGGRGGAGRGGGGFGGEGFEPVDVPPVEFSANIPEATEAAVKDDKPFLVFFCTQEMAKFAGAGSQAVREYRKEAEGKLPAFTPFETATVTDAMNRSGYKIVKVIAAPQTAAVARKYKVTTAPALVACAPTSDVMAVLQGPTFTQTNVLKMLSDMKTIYAQWKKMNPDKVPEKAPEKPAQPAAEQPAQPAAEQPAPPAGNEAP